MTLLGYMEATSILLPARLDIIWLRSSELKLPGPTLGLKLVLRG
jgi:hypothetical protein